MTTNLILEETTLPIVFVNSEEVETFRKSPMMISEASSYLWENESVYHIYLTPPCHSFGKEGKVIVAKSADDLEAQYSDESIQFFLLVLNDTCILKMRRENSIEECALNYIPSKEDLYSRNKGILELNILEQKRVMIVGLGSFGSQIAIELAKAGVGEFALFDFDRVELHNLARHTCTTKDLGRLKTDAIYDAIVGKNPYAKVDRFPVNINKNIDNGLLDDEVKKADIIICATDNNQSRFNLSEALVRHQKVGIFGRAITRAEGGDVFRYRPGGPCYCCLVGTGTFDAAEEEITNLESARREGRIPAYMAPDEAEAAVQVGLSADIEPMCNLMVKLTLMELSRGMASGISSLENELIYDYYMWANRRETKYANWAPLPNSANMPTILRWYGVKVHKADGCPVCSQTIILDEGEDVFGLSDIDLDLNTDGLELED